MKVSFDLDSKYSFDEQANNERAVSKKYSMALVIRSSFIYCSSGKGQSSKNSIVCIVPN